MRWSCRYRGETVPFPISYVLHILKYEYFNTAKFVNIFHLCTVLLPLSQQDKKHKSRLISSYCFTIPAKISRAKKRQKKKKNQLQRNINQKTFQLTHYHGKSLKVLDISQEQDLLLAWRQGKAHKHFKMISWENYVKMVRNNLLSSLLVNFG